ncbi:UTRA domain-containing protein [Streptomyces sp. Isolate_45]|uniref:UTRA domain-containing protein n=1 Tax=Streptomyces sp. Isolate_45 TaxID=2950111 RepID=UPI002481DB21|nr:UTRA domain-containing protein [Streptomyces sp. Isolate_45]MDA5284639.1 UTRA domain-containing protein [Streptomyces sp. Isolate_45]
MPSNTIDADGTITRDARSRYRQRAEGGAHGAFEAETKRAGGTPRADVDVTRGAAPADVAALLGDSADTVIRSRRMYDGERLVQLCDTFIPAFVAEAAPAVAQLDTGAGGIISRMADAGLTQVEVVEDVTQVPATAEQAAALGVEAGELLLTITHTGTTEDGRVVEVSRHTLSRGWTLRYGVPLN